MISGCSDKYTVLENHCIVGLHEDFKLYSQNESDFCTPIEKAIKGIEKKDNTNYYSVEKEANYTIIVNNFIDAKDGVLSWGTMGDLVINSAIWQGHIITRFEKVYGENSNLENEVIYTTNYKKFNDNISVTFSEDCTIKSYVEPYMNVGGIYEIVEKGNQTKSYDNVPLNEDGTITEKKGLYYLLLKDEVCTHQDAYKTNFEIKDYKYDYVNNVHGLGEVDIQAQFTAEPLPVGENEELLLYYVCRTYSGKYFVYPSVYTGTTGFTLPMGRHELKFAFDFN